MYQIPKLQIYLNFFIVFIAFSQVYDKWVEKPALAYFFLIGGIAILLLNVMALVKSATNKKNPSN